MQTKSLYIASLEPAAGSLIVAMGIMEMLKGRMEKVAFFRPVIPTRATTDGDIDFMLGYFSLQQSYEDTFGFSVDEVETMVASGNRHDLMEALIGKFKLLESQYDFVLCEGLSSSSLTSSFDFDINLEIAKNLGVPVVTVLNGNGKTLKEVHEEIRIESATIKTEGCTHFATFANRLSQDVFETLKKDESLDSDQPVFLLPEIPELDSPTIAEIKKYLKCDMILGGEQDLRRVVKQSKVAAMTMEHFLDHLEDGDLVIVPGDRPAIMLAAIAANYSKVYPTIAGILLTGGFVPKQAILELVQGITHFNGIPVLTSTKDTFKTAMDVNNVPARITPQSKRKIALAMGLFNANVDKLRIEEKIKTSTASSAMTPIMFEYSLFEKARSNKKTIVLPESEDVRILRAAEILLRRDVVNLVLLGNESEVMHKAMTLGLDLKGVRIIDPATSPLSEEFVTAFYELRKAKGLKLAAAKDAMVSPNYFATMMVYLGHADGMVSGAVHTTADTIRPALQTIKTKPGISVVSSVFFMCLDTRVLVYGDCAVNQDPNAQELAQIAISSAQTAKAFGVEPRIAMLSYSTGDSGSGDEVEKVRTATKLVKELRPDLLVEGPIQYDAAIDPQVAKTKLPNSKVAGQATVFIFPDLNTGNNTYKAVQRSSGALAIGPVLQGLNKPINDLSRGCLVEDIVNTVAITAIQAQGDNA
ncbi:phosphate acetyltransferase [Sulfurospirillum sp. T05]|uniref:Phosphate acetyltransferase n=1 Tax=Sulfurospirillum tamanense TaxID=2813362 RepID=A0ABS2WR56_9BACT|nr:phosphate acetyltransferase [Sulfurospirillum tamanensis]MBN2964120.1 phosphate acetyltransferase [Sulfurospirillum tamanensis]